MKAAEELTKNGQRIADIDNGFTDVKSFKCKNCGWEETLKDGSKKLG